MEIKKEIRKKIGKEAGDSVHVILYADNTPLSIPDELMVCLLDSPQAHAFFMSLNETQQKAYIDWIYGAKRLETKVNRIALTVEKLEKGLKMSDKEDVL